MERFEVVLAKDGMQAEIAACPGPPPSKAELSEALRIAGIVHGIDATAINRLCLPGADTRTIVARGTAALTGKDEQLRPEAWHSKLPGKATPAGMIDYHERQYLHPIRRSETLGSIEASTVGTAGMDVRGRVLPGIDGQPLRLRLGNGAVRKGNAIIAQRDGVALVNEELIDVVPLYTHASSVGYASGNLHSAGSLLIEGDVDEGFLAEADGDIAVTGTVQGELRAKGSVLVEQGILGKQAVHAGADLRCHHATNANLRAGGNLVVADHVAQCRIQAKSVLILDGRAMVRGGQVGARDRILVGSAGAVAGTPTLLAVGQLFDERAELARRDASAQRESRMSKRAADRGRASKSNRRAVKATDHALAEKLRLKRLQRELLRKATIEITSNCYSGVTIEFGRHHLEVDRDLHAVIFRFDLETDTIQQSAP